MGVYWTQRECDMGVKHLQNKKSDEEKGRVCWFLWAKREKRKRLNVKLRDDRLIEIGRA